MRKTVFLIGMIVLLATGGVCARVELTVQGSCKMCKTRIEKTARSVEGVTSATWDAESKKLSLDFDEKKTSLDAVSKALAKAGHDTDRHKADDKTYRALPECCKYRKK